MKILCPLIKKPCLEHGCQWYAHLEGINPQTGKPMDHWDCAIKWIPVMITEQARQTRGVQASVEDFRNKSIQQQTELNEKMMGAAGFMHMVDSIAKRSPQLPDEPISPLLED
jgi:hypothetical protein